MAAVLDVLTRLSVPPPGARPGSGPSTILASTLVCAAAFLLLHATGAALPTSKRLKRKDAIEWNLRVVSTVHAVVLSLGAFACLAETWPLPRAASVVGYAHAPDVFARIFLGYLAYDLIAMIVFYKELQDPSGLLHHVLFMPCAAYVLAHSIMAFPFVWLSFCEVSTPFVNLRWHLAATDRKSTPLYLYNGLLVAALFFVARVLFYGAGLAHLASTRDVWGAPGLPFGHRGVVFMFAVGYALNLYWMASIFKAAKRAMKRGGEGGGARREQGVHYE